MPEGKAFDRGALPRKAHVCACLAVACPTAGCLARHSHQSNVKGGAESPLVHVYNNNTAYCWRPPPVSAA
eukprot:866232-Pleurochrysis_carterae.AAC.2